MSDIENRIENLEEVYGIKRKEVRLSPEEEQELMGRLRSFAKDDGVETDQEFEIWLRKGIERLERQGRI